MMKCIVALLLATRATALEDRGLLFGSAPSFKRTTKLMVEGLGEVRLVCERESSESLKLYVEADANAWENLASFSSGFEVSIMAPSGCDPYKHAFLTFGAGGHPPWDGRQFNGERPGGYGVPHLDVHFFVVTPAEREALTGTCKVFDPGPADSKGQLLQCNETAPETSAFMKLPPAEYITGFSHDGAFGGHSIRFHGHHLVPDDDLAPGGPAHCVSTGPSSGGPAGWLDCHEQFLGSVTPNPTEGSFVDKDCTCGYWADQISAIVNVYDGQVLGNEAMPTLALAGLLRNGEVPNPFYKPYPQADKYQTAGHRPVSVMAALDPSTVTFMTGLALHPEYMEAN
mmetsp:Transcript_50640/g.162884  ORF Transcript_50640/g.162884 Transcript_50640/m.162884 type:complete len:341 (+) Transcript_50640:47-1069(+)